MKVSKILGHPQRGHRTSTRAKNSGCLCLFYVLLCFAFLAALFSSSPSPQSTTFVNQGTSRDIDGHATHQRNQVDSHFISRIQRECFRTYPKNLLSILTKNATEHIPEDVDAEPTKQMDLLTDIASTEKGRFYPSLLEDLFPIMRGYITDGTNFLDLGSGDGRIVFLASALGANATGVEYDQKLVEQSRMALSSLSAASGSDPVIDASRTNIVHGDYFEMGFSDYDVLFYFGEGGTYDQDKLKQKIRDEMNPAAKLLYTWEKNPFPGLELEGMWTLYPVEKKVIPVVSVYRQFRNQEH